MRKIPQEIENPFDNICIDFSELLSPYFKKMNFTPNGITTLSLISGIYSFILYMQTHYLASAFFFVLQYLFDCMDGFYARKYNLISKFGDYYDHLKDLLITILFAFGFLSKYLKLKSPDKYLPFLLIFFIFISSLHLGCQEVFYNKDPKKTADMLKFGRCLCPYTEKEDVYEFMKLTRYGGTGTMVLFIVFLILYSYIVDQKLSS